MKFKNFALAATAAALLVTAAPLPVHATGESGFEVIEISDVDVSGVDLTPIAGQEPDLYGKVTYKSNHADIAKVNIAVAWVELDDNNKVVSWTGDGHGNVNVGWPEQTYTKTFKPGVRYGFTFCLSFRLDDQYADDYGYDCKSVAAGNVTFNGQKLEGLKSMSQSSDVGWVYYDLTNLMAVQVPHEDNCNKMYRLYNPNSGEHFYTSGTAERQNVVDAGWNYEGIGWLAPKSGTPVFRMYNPVAGEHHYTTSKAEADSLVAAGWNLESECAWYSAPAETGAPLYREYNPNAYACNHNYSPSQEENDMLVNAGWQYEGIAWYGVQ